MKLSPFAFAVQSIMDGKEFKDIFHEMQQIYNYHEIEYEAYLVLENYFDPHKELYLVARQNVNQFLEDCYLKRCERA